MESTKIRVNQRFVATISVKKIADSLIITSTNEEFVIKSDNPDFEAKVDDAITACIADENTRFNGVKQSILDDYNEQKPQFDIDVQALKDSFDET